MEIEDAARNILDSMRGNYCWPHELRAVVDDRAFSGVDRRHYRRRQKECDALGFTKIGDLEDVTINRNNPQMFDTFMRLLRNAEGSITAAIYHGKMKRSWWKRLLTPFSSMANHRVLEFTSVFTDGTMVVTSTVPEMMLPHFPDVTAYSLPRNTGAVDLCQRHRRAVKEHLRSRVGRKLLPVMTLEDAIATQQRMYKRASEYLESQGWVTKEHLLRVGNVSEEVAEAVYLAVRRILWLEKAGQEAGRGVVIMPACRIGLPGGWSIEPDELSAFASTETGETVRFSFVSLDGDVPVSQRELAWELLEGTVREAIDGMANQPGVSREQLEETSAIDGTRVVQQLVVTEEHRLVFQAALIGQYAIVFVTFDGSETSRRRLDELRHALLQIQWDTAAQAA